MMSLMAIITCVIIYAVSNLLILQLGGEKLSISECILMTFMVFCIGLLDLIYKKLDK